MTESSEPEKLDRLEEEYPELVHKVLYSRLTRKFLYVAFLGYFKGQMNSSSEGQKVSLTVRGGEESKPFLLPFLPSGLRGFKTLFSSLKVVRVRLPDEADINNPVRFHQRLEQGELKHQPVLFYSRKAERNTRLYYVPFSARYYKNVARHLRRTKESKLIFVQRPKFQIEDTLRFRFWESRLVSGTLYNIARVSRKFSRKEKIVFYEKFASKAEEGTFELFQMVRRHNKHSFFVLDPESSQFDSLSDEENLVPRFSLRYYWTIFSASVFVGTEVPTHLSLLRSNNSWARRKYYSTPYVFLQHGIIFMKNLGPTSVYVKGREGEPDFIVASSEKESLVIQRDLCLSKEQIWVTGLGQFSLMEYDYIKQESRDIVTIMLTWRPYDEKVLDAEQTSYLRVLNEAVQQVKQSLPEAELRIVPHPKFSDALSLSDMQGLLWRGSVSEALQDTKLLLTDYSSIAYNAFYRGAGVIFYQPDLDEYESATGKLIPEPEEYVGHRAFDPEELRSVLGQGQSANGSVDLSFFRTEQFLKNYAEINSFNDGANLDRIAEKLRAILSS